MFVLVLFRDVPLQGDTRSGEGNRVRISKYRDRRNAVPQFLVVGEYVADEHNGSLHLCPESATITQRTGFAENNRHSYTVLPKKVNRNRQAKTSLASDSEGILSGSRGQGKRRRAAFPFSGNIHLDKYGVKV